MKLSIIIVNYKTPLLVVRCIESIIQTISHEIFYEIIVVDNNSNDDSEKIVKNIFRDIIWIAKAENDGFGRANNVGIKASKGEFLLLLNSDIVVCKNTINESLKKIEENKEIGILGCKMLNENGTVQKSVYYNFANIKSQLENNLLFDYFFKFNKTQYRAIMGSYMLITKKVLDKSGLFDPDFFMYSEEIELCIRIKKHGYALNYFEEVYAYHKHGASSTNTKLTAKQRLVSNALLVYKLNGVIIYFVFFILSFINTLTNFYLMWFLDKNYRKSFFESEKLFYSNFFYYLAIPFIYSRKIGNGRKLLRRT